MWVSALPYTAMEDEVMVCGARSWLSVGHWLEDPGKLRPLVSLPPTLCNYRESGMQ